MDTLTRPDERAAGVISGSDPYRELELYLEKVNEEIGEVFDHWNRPLVGVVGGSAGEGEGGQPSEVGPRKRRPTAVGGKRESGGLTAWSDGLLAEFNNIIAEELSQLLAKRREEEGGGSIGGGRGVGEKEEGDVKGEIDGRGLEAEEDLQEEEEEEEREEEEGEEEEGEEEEEEEKEEKAVEIGVMRYRDRRRRRGEPVLLRVSPLPPPQTPSQLINPASVAALKEKDEAEDSGLERSAEILDSPSVNDPDSKDFICQEDCGTQTSPPVSRSSSFTWLSDSSSLPGRSPPDSVGEEEEEEEEEEDSTSTSSSSGGPPRRRRHSSSGTSGGRDDPESGIGTSSPPPHPRTGNKVGSISSNNGQKCRRKETWERLRRRQSGLSPGGRGDWIGGGETVWVRREGGGSDTGGNIGSGSKPPRPTCLPLPPPSPTASSHYSSPLASPSSLKASAPPLPPELTNKSSSAPILANSSKGHQGRTSTPTKKIQKQPRSQSERHLTEIEAGEACKWLRAAGFPQYAQM